MKSFEVKIEHLKLLNNLSIRYDEYTEFGAPEVDPKRPYGDGDVYESMGKILNISPTIEEDEDMYFSTTQESKFDKLHKDMTYVLQIICKCNGVEPGLYTKEEYHDNWKRT